MTTPAPARCTGYRFPAEIISYTVWLYFPLPARSAQGRDAGGMTASLPRAEDQRTVGAPARHQCAVPRHEVLSRLPQHCRDRRPRIRPVPHQRLGPAPLPLGGPISSPASAPTAPPGRLCAIVEPPPLTQSFGRRGRGSKAGSSSQQYLTPPAYSGSSDLAEKASSSEEMSGTVGRAPVDGKNSRPGPFWYIRPSRM
jgi:hypothetical protein